MMNLFLKEDAIKLAEQTEFNSLEHLKHTAAYLTEQKALKPKNIGFALEISQKKTNLS